MKGNNVSQNFAFSPTTFLLPVKKLKLTEMRHIIFIFHIIKQGLREPTLSNLSLVGF